MHLSAYRTRKKLLQHPSTAKLSAVFACSRIYRALTKCWSTVLWHGGKSHGALRAGLRAHGQAVTPGQVTRPTQEIAQADATSPRPSQTVPT